MTDHINLNKNTYDGDLDVNLTFDEDLTEKKSYFHFFFDCL